MASWLSLVHYAFNFIKNKINMLSQTLKRGGGGGGAGVREKLRFQHLDPKLRQCAYII